MPTHKAGSLIHCHRAYDEPQEWSLSIRRHCWEWEAEERRKALVLWEADNIRMLENENKRNRSKEYCRDASPRPECLTIV